MGMQESGRKGNPLQSQSFKVSSMDACEMRQFSILIVDENAADAVAIRDCFLDSACARRLDIAADFEAAAVALRSAEFDVCIFSYRPGAHTGLELLQQLKAVGSDLPVILLADQGSEEVAVAALRAGASDYVARCELSSGALNAAVRHAVELHATQRQHHEVQQALVREKEFIAAILQHSYDGIAVVDPEGRVTYYSPGMVRIFGYTQEDIPDVAAWAEAIGLDPTTKKQWHDTICEGMALPGGRGRIFQFKHQNGDRRWCRMHFAAMSSPERGAQAKDIVINGQDITSVKLAEERVEYVAMHDPLTGLPSRRLFQDRLKQAIVHAQRNHTLAAVLYVDLDKFKPVNDTYGHEAGDAVLQEVAARLKSCLRASDTVARVGGDEFVVILPALASRPDAMPVAEKMVTSLCRPYSFGDRNFEVGASVGIAIYPRDARDLDTLLSNADKAMYTAKNSGGRRYEFYEPELA